MSFRTATAAFELIRPLRQETPLVFSSPHSGRAYAPEFLQRAQLDSLEIRSSEDAFVDDLFASVPGRGAPFLKANAPRAYLDLNRAADELDPALIEGLVRAPHNPRISSGLGVIPRVVAQGRPIYHGKITRAEADDRIARVWRPYHAALQGLMEETLQNFGEAVLIDCHSMPHEAIETQGRPGALPPEVVLGDRFGAAASRDVTDRLEMAFRRAGLRVARNAPFAGAYIAQAYGRPSRRQHVVQVEIDRALYLDEARVAKRPDFAAFQQLIEGVLSEVIAAFGPGRTALAAE